MESHKVYTCIVEAVKIGKLKEPFTTDDFKTAKRICGTEDD